MRIFTVDDFFAYAEVLRDDGTYLRPTDDWELESILYDEEGMETLKKEQPNLQVWTFISEGEYDSIRDGIRTGEVVLGYIFSKVPANALCFADVRMPNGVTIRWYSPAEADGKEAEEAC